MSVTRLPDPILITPTSGQPLVTFNPSRSSTITTIVQTAISSTQRSSANGETGTKGKGPNVGAIVGGILGSLIVVALVLFFVRQRYIRQRQSGTHAQTVRARMAQMQISGPTNFSHLESGTLASDTSSIGKLTIQTHNLRNNTTGAMTVNSKANGSDSGSLTCPSESPVEVMKNLDSGLGSQLHAMRNQRRTPPTLGSGA